MATMYRRSLLPARCLGRAVPHKEGERRSGGEKFLRWGIPHDHVQLRSVGPPTRIEWRDRSRDLAALPRELYVSFRHIAASVGLAHGISLY
jgi:hypothetical protein